MTTFYNELYENLYANKGYHASESLTSTHYPSFMTGCIIPSKMEFETLLDIGCSTGIGIKSFFEPLGKTGEGIDVSETAVKKANERGVKAKVASVTDIPHDDDSFDLVCSTDVIEHLKPEDQEKAHRECFRVARKYVAHKISNTPEGNKYGQPLHLTVWNINTWFDFFESVKPEGWELIFKITPENYEELKYDIERSIGQGREPETYESWIYNNTIVVFEKKG